MAKGDQEKKSVNWSSPYVVYGGLAVLILVFGKTILEWASGFLASLHKDPSITPSGEPVLSPLDTFHVRAKFVEPSDGGHLKSSVVPFAMVRLKVELNNPGEQPKGVSLRVEVEWFPRIVGEKSKTAASLQLLAPVGRSTHMVEVARPVTVALTIDAVAAVFVDGQQFSSVAFVVD